eukprot:GHVU01141515.1.p1 GENE.GHVU01141515.1~~GHVU01141515.1.p1  ORF type:complete len:164 (+),score=10.31 GHVU01141515.1:58-492(+)
MPTVCSADEGTVNRPPPSTATTRSNPPHCNAGSNDDVVMRDEDDTLQAYPLWSVPSERAERADTESSPPTHHSVPSEHPPGMQFRQEEPTSSTDSTRMMMSTWRHRIRLRRPTTPNISYFEWTRTYHVLRLPGSSARVRQPRFQ